MPGISIFKDVPLVPTDHVFHVNQNYNDDKHPKKVNLGIGGKFLIISRNQWRYIESHRLWSISQFVIYFTIYARFSIFRYAFIAYRDDSGKPMVLDVVKNVEKQLADEIADKILNHEYLPIDGLKLFTDAACKLALGPDSPAIVENRVRIHSLSLERLGFYKVFWRLKAKNVIKSKQSHLYK